MFRIPIIILSPESESFEQVKKRKGDGKPDKLIRLKNKNNSKRALILS